MHSRLFFLKDTQSKSAKSNKISQSLKVVTLKVSQSFKQSQSISQSALSKLFHCASPCPSLKPQKKCSIFGKEILPKDVHIIFYSPYFEETTFPEKPLKTFLSYSVVVIPNFVYCHGLLLASCIVDNNSDSTISTALS